MSSIFSYDTAGGMLLSDVPILRFARRYPGTRKTMNGFKIRYHRNGGSPWRTAGERE